MIEFKNVSFSYGPNPILKDVSFKVEEKQTLIILGGSGSGKTTILRLLLGLIEADSGTILLDGEDITQASHARMVEVRKKMGMVFQDGALFDSLTVGENVGYFLMEHGGHHTNEIEKKIREMLSLVGLEKTIDMMPAELSGGMRRRVATARSLIYRPEVMLYDEPTTGLDPATCENICDLINDVKKLGVSAIFVTHNLKDAFEVGDRFLLLRDGGVVWQGGIRELKAKPAGFLDDFFREKASSGGGR